MHQIQRERVQGEIVCLPQQRGAVLDLQHLQRPVPLIGYGLAHLLMGGAERENIPTNAFWPVARWAAMMRWASSSMAASGSSMSMSLPACMARTTTPGVQRRGQANVNQVHRRVGNERVEAGGGEPELAADRG